MIKHIILILLLSAVSFAQIYERKNIEVVRANDRTLIFTYNEDLSNDTLLFVVKATRSISSPRLIQKESTDITEMKISYFANVSMIEIYLQSQDTEDRDTARHWYDITRVHNGDSTTLFLGWFDIWSNVATRFDGTNLATDGSRFYVAGAFVDSTTADSSLFMWDEDTQSIGTIPYQEYVGTILPDSILYPKDSTSQRTYSDLKYVDKTTIQLSYVNYNKQKYRPAIGVGKNLNIIGNSISEGVGVTNWANDSYVGLLKKRYKTFYGTTNEGFVNIDSTEHYKYADVSYSGFTASGVQGSYFGANYATSSTSGHYIQYSYTGGSAYLVYKTVVGGGSLQVFVNDTLRTTINTGSGTASNYTISSKINGYYGANILKILKTDNLPTAISGVYFTDDLSDFAINNYGKQNLQFVEVSDDVLYKYAQANGVIVSLGVNDKGFSANVDTMKAKLRRLLGYVQDNNGTAIVCDWLFLNDQSNVYKTGLREVTAEFPQFAFLDIEQCFYSDDVFGYSFTPDGVHPNAYGHKIVADKLSEMLGLVIPDSIDNQNFAFLKSQLVNNTTGKYNMGAGFASLLGNTTGNRNTAFGIQALRDNRIGSDNTAFGFNSMIWDTSGYSNTAFGSYSLSLNLSGYLNSAFGLRALYSNRTGYQNSAFGHNALLSNQTGHDNSAVGISALQNNLSGNYNLAIGTEALRDNVSGSFNTGIGFSSLLNTEGLANTGIGMNSGLNIIGANFNTSIGFGSLLSDVTGENNTAIGGYALFSTLGSGNVGIGYNAGYNETGSNKLYIDNSNTADPLIWGDFNTDSLEINGNLNVVGDIYINGTPLDLTPGTGTFSPDGVTIDTTAGGLARINPSIKNRIDSVWTKQPLESTLTDIADGTITENLVNTANPWADNEVANNITVDDAGIASTIARDSEVSALLVAFSDTLAISWGMMDTVLTGDVSGWKAPNNITITEISSYTNSGTVTFNLEERGETTPNTAGTDVMTSDLVADTDQQETSTFSNAAIDRNDWLIPTVTSISGDPTIFSITIRYIKTN